MASLFMIQMNYNNAIRQAKKLENAAADLKKLASHDLQNSVSDINAAWTGDNARQFVAKGEQLKERIEKTAEGMRATANTIRRIAQQIHYTEMRNYNLIRG